MRILCLVGLKSICIPEGMVMNIGDISISLRWSLGRGSKNNREKKQVAGLFRPPKIFKVKMFKGLCHVEIFYLN